MRAVRLGEFKPAVLLIALFVFLGAQCLSACLAAPCDQPVRSHCSHEKEAPSLGCGHQLLVSDSAPVPAPAELLAEIVRGVTPLDDSIFVVSAVTQVTAIGAFPPLLSCTLLRI